ncbi:MAG: dihydrolipoamide acetyltransferase family protein [Aggregatilineales bacterium]
MPTNIMMPEMGEGVVEGTVVTWLKHEGDDVREDEAVLEIETDKVTVEINAESDGVLLKECVNAGDTVPVGTVLAIVGNADENVEHVPTSPTVPQQEKQSSPAEEKNQPEVAKPANGSNLPIPAVPKTRKLAPSQELTETRVSPVVARMVSEHSLDVSEIEGTGRDGRITKRDVLAYMEGETEATTESTGTKTAPLLKQNESVASPVSSDTKGELMPLSGMRRAIAEHMVMSKHTSPHATTVFEFDYTKVAKHRAANKAQFEKDGAKLTYMPYLIHAVAIALKNHPLVNSSWTDDGILLKRDINIGIAVAVERGLIVPVIKQADSMNLLGIARALTDIAERARSNKLMPQDLQGGTFSITNHGASGSLIGTPIINQPQVGILGIGVIEKRVKVINDAIAIRPNAFVSFSFDHRVLDGATADAFVMDIKQHIENYA